MIHDKGHLILCVFIDLDVGPNTIQDSPVLSCESAIVLFAKIQSEARG